VERLWEDWSPGWKPAPAAMAELRATFASPGVAEAALSYYRCAFGSVKEPGAHVQLQRRMGTEPVSVSGAIGNG